MTRPTPVRCPSESCGAEFVVAASRLGRSTHCPSCGIRMTARPLEVERKLLAQQARIRGGEGARIDRLPLTVVLDNVRSLWNVGSMFRTADACGVQEMVLTGVTGYPPRPELTKTALGAEEAVAWSYLADPLEAVRRLSAAGFEPVALETSPRAVPLDRFEWPDRVALVVGNEVAGIGAPVLDECARHLSLPMLGVKDSLNVAVAFGIAAFAAARGGTAVIRGGLRIVRRWARTFAVLGLALALGVAAPAPCAEAGGAEDSIELPVSFGKVWFRPGRDSGLGSGKQSGLLTVSESGLEFLAKKQTHVLPWSRIEMVSYGRMPGDLDTKWVVLSLNPVDEQQIVIGYRDGQKFGYGGDTTRIFDAIVEGLRRSGAGPFAVPQGSSAFVTPFLQFALALPGGWHPYSVSETYLDGRPTWGRTIFSALDFGQMRNDEARVGQALAAIRSGSAPAVFLDRFEAGGFSCGRLGKTGRRKLHEQINAALRPMRLVSELDWTERPHRSCTAWTSTGRATRGDDEIQVAFYAVSDDQTAYVFTTLTTTGAEIDERFEPLSRSLKTAVAH